MRKGTTRRRNSELRASADTGRYLPQGRPRSPEYDQMAEGMVAWYDEGEHRGEKVSTGPYRNRKDMNRVRMGFRASAAFAEMPKVLKEEIRSRASQDGNGMWWLHFMLREA